MASTAKKVIKVEVKTTPKTAIHMSVMRFDKNTGKIVCGTVTRPDIKMDCGVKPTVCIDEKTDKCITVHPKPVGKCETPMCVYPKRPPICKAKPVAVSIMADGTRKRGIIKGAETWILPKSKDSALNFTHRGDMFIMIYPNVNKDRYMVSNIKGYPDTTFTNGDVKRIISTDGRVARVVAAFGKDRNLHDKRVGNMVVENTPGYKEAVSKWMVGQGLTQDIL